MTNPETGYEKAHRQVEQIFRQFFPARGMVTREGQIRLCHMMLDALFGLDVALCDAGVGLGKTYAYLVACVLWQLQRPRQMQRPVVISTASVALQSAILTEYIPFLSNILIQNGYIQKPICAVLRKGKERFACDRRLLIRQKQIGIRGERFRRRAAALRAANQCLDLDLLPGISRHDRRLICVPERCSRSCILHSDCRYRQYLKDSNGASVTIQVCNHNYLLADAAHRQNGWKPLLKDYQALVIDEAHKLPETVRQMNTRRIRSSDLLHFERIYTASSGYIKVRITFCPKTIRRTTDMKAICFMQEVKEGDLTIREQMLVCRRALRKLRWPCVLELFAQAGTEEQPLSLRPGMVELLHAAANGEADVLVVVDAAHLYCGRPELEGLLASLLHYGIHTFGAKDGNWIEPGGRRWMVLPGYDEEVWNG